jgi:hypothetical protein
MDRTWGFALMGYEKNKENPNLNFLRVKFSALRQGRFILTAYAIRK